MSLLRKLRKGKVDAVKAAKSLKEKDAISDDVILMANEIYLQKSAYHSGGEYIRVDSSGNAYKGIMVFMICGLKSSIPIVIKTYPEISLNGEWVATHMADCISILSKSSFKVRAIVIDNHSSNVNAFKALQKMFHAQASDSSLFVQHPENLIKTYLFFDYVHLLKNIRNNLLNSKKFVFSEFSFSCLQQTIVSKECYISWDDMKNIHDKDSKLSANSRKASSCHYQHFFLTKISKT